MDLEILFKIIFVEDSMFWTQLHFIMFSVWNIKKQQLEGELSDSQGFKKCQMITPEIVPFLQRHGPFLWSLWEIKQKFLCLWDQSNQWESMELTGLSFRNSKKLLKKKACLIWNHYFWIC